MIYFKFNIFIHNILHIDQHIVSRSKMYLRNFNYLLLLEKQSNTFFLFKNIMSISLTTEISGGYQPSAGMNC